MVHCPSRDPHSAVSVKKCSFTHEFSFCLFCHNYTLNKRFFDFCFYFSVNFISFQIFIEGNQICRLKLFKECSCLASFVRSFNNLVLRCGKHSCLSSPIQNSNIYKVVQQCLITVFLKKRNLLVCCKSPKAFDTLAEATLICSFQSSLLST